MTPDYVAAARAARADAAHPQHWRAMRVDPAALATVRWTREGAAWRCETCGELVRPWRAAGHAPPDLAATIEHYCRHEHSATSHLADDLRADLLPLWPAALLFAQAAGYPLEGSARDAAQQSLRAVEFEDLRARAVALRRTALAAQLAAALAVARAAQAGAPLWRAGLAWPAAVAAPGVWYWAVRSAGWGRLAGVAAPPARPAT